MAGVVKYGENELVMLLQQRSQAAFSYLYDNYAAALNGVIVKLIDDEALAEDILQESFLKIWNNIENYDATKGRLFTWMLNITRNLTIDTLRSKGYKKQAKISPVENSVNEYADKGYSAESFDALGIKNYLGILKPDQQNVVDLAYFSGFTQDEIAAKLGVPLGTVKTRMRAALIELRKVLQNK